MKNPAKRVVTFLILFSFAGNSIAQTGGNNTYEALNFTNSARVAALGGYAISINDNDLNMAQYNPSLLNNAMHNHLSLNYIDYFSDIKYTSFLYSRTFQDLGSIGTGVQYIHYGTFKETDETGTIVREFNAEDIIVNLGWGRAITPIITTPKKKELILDSMFTIGANLKFIYSSYHFDYNSLGIAVDFAGTYHNPKRNLTLAVLVKNAGVQIKPYTSKNREPLPFEVQMGISKKLKHAPFRLSLTARHLEKWDLTYSDPALVKSSLAPNAADTLSKYKFGEKVSGFTDKLLRHGVVGVEILLLKNFQLMFGYNYQRRKDLMLSTKKGLVGFSFGAGVKISKFHFSYGRAAYHLAGGTNHFSITTNLSDFYTVKNRHDTPLLQE